VYSAALYPAPFLQVCIVTFLDSRVLEGATIEDAGAHTETHTAQEAVRHPLFGSSAFFCFVLFPSIPLSLARSLRVGYTRRIGGSVIPDAVPTFFSLSCCPSSVQVPLGILVFIISSSSFCISLDDVSKTPFSGTKKARTTALCSAGNAADRFPAASISAASPLNQRKKRKTRSHDFPSLLFFFLSFLHPLPPSLHTLTHTFHRGTCQLFSFSSYYYFCLFVLGV
jgi:hypothetical protein